MWNGRGGDGLRPSHAIRGRDRQGQWKQGDLNIVAERTNENDDDWNIVSNSSLSLSARRRNPPGSSFWPPRFGFSRSRESQCGRKEREKAFWSHSHSQHHSLQRAAVGLTLRFCLFLFRSSSCNIFLAWLHSSCSMAHQPVELSRNLLTKPCV